jgi:hypothetical protein
MKKILIALSLLIFTSLQGWAQGPNSFNYQGVVRNSAGVPWANRNISLRLTVHDGISMGTALYQETFTVTTNNFGLYNVGVGTGTPTPPFTASSWTNLNWGAGPRYLQVEVDSSGGIAFTSMGSTQLLSVPYALFANTTSGGPGAIVTDPTLTGTGVAGNPLKIAQQGATTGQILRWNGTTWSPVTAGSGTVTNITATAPLTGGSITTTGSIGLANSGVTAGTYGSPITVPQITVDAFGRITSATDLPMRDTGTVTGITVGTGLFPAGTTITTSGTISLPNVGSPGTYGSGTFVPVITTDAQGRVTGVTNTPITVAGSGTVTLINTTAGQLTGGPITTTGTLGLATVGTAGTYGTSTGIPRITTDAYGRVTAVTIATVTPGITSTGTADYITKFTSPTAITNSGMYEDPTTSNIGIGTTAPVHTFEVNSSASAGGVFNASSATADTIGNFESTNFTPPTTAVLTGIYSGLGTFSSSTGILGQSVPDIFTAIGTGVTGFGGTSGVFGNAQNMDFTTGAQAVGVLGQSQSDCDYGVAVAGFADAFFFGANNNYGVYGTTDGSGFVEDFAGKFIGNVDIQGTLTATSKSFKMDHPLDPANKFLYHACVESNEMMNIYTGNITTDASGAATVVLPDYFEALNKDFRYQLTVIGTFAQAIIGEKIHDNKFTIKTNQPNVEVSWQVTGVRHDAYANAHPLIAEVPKPAALKGKYLSPVELGKSKDLQIGHLKPADVKKASTSKSAGKNGNRK